MGPVEGGSAAPLPSTRMQSSLRRFFCLLAPRASAGSGAAAAAAAAAAGAPPPPPKAAAGDCGAPWLLGARGGRCVDSACLLASVSECAPCAPLPLLPCTAWLESGGEARCAGRGCAVA